MSNEKSAEKVDSQRVALKAHIDGLVQSENQFRKNVIRHTGSDVEFLAGFFTGEISPTYVGYSYDEVTLQKVASHLNAIQHLAKKGRIIFNESIRRKSIFEKYQELGLEPPAQYEQSKKPRLQLVK